MGSRPSRTPLRSFPREGPAVAVGRLRLRPAAGRSGEGAASSRLRRARRRARGEAATPRFRVALGAFGFLAALAVAAQPAWAKPARVVSLNLCADQLVLLLADRERIASVSFLARDPTLSYMAEAARGVPVNYGHLEEVLAAEPDLVVAGVHAARRTTALLKRFGVSVLEVDIPRNLAEVRTQIMTLARALGEEARGERLVAGMDERLRAVSPRPGGPSPVAVVYNPNGRAIGEGTLANDLLRRAGLKDLAARLGLGGFAPLPLESLILHAPDLLVLSEDRPGEPSLAQAFLHHPALRAAIPAARTVSIPSSLWICEGPFNVEAVELLAAAKGRLAGEGGDGGSP